MTLHISQEAQYTGDGVPLCEKHAVMYREEYMFPGVIHRIVEILANQGATIKSYKGLIEYTNKCRTLEGECFECKSLPKNSVQSNGI